MAPTTRARRPRQAPCSSPRASSVPWLPQIRVIECHDRLGRVPGGCVDRAASTILGAELHLHGIDSVGGVTAVGADRVSAVVPGVFAGSARRYIVGGEDCEPVGCK